MSAREIAGISFGRGRQGVLVALRAYFDKSGDESSHGVITVGGFFAESSICETIESEWEEATNGKLFHLKNYASDKCELGSAQWTQDERTAFLKRLAGIVNRPGCGIVSSSLEVAPFNKTISSIEHPQEIGPAFSACAYGSIATTEYSLMKDGRQQEQLRYVFEKGDREHEIAYVFNDLDKKDSHYFGSRGYGFEPKQRTTLLQPADFIAGIVQRCLVRALRAFPCLDNGLSRTKLRTFERHYSYDGITEAVVSGHDTDKCVIFSPKNFAFLDEMTKRFYEDHPDEAQKRKKHLRFKP